LQKSPSDRHDEALRRALERLQSRRSDEASSVPGTELGVLALLLKDALVEIEREREETKRKLLRIADKQCELDARLIALEQSRVFRTLRWAGRIASLWRGKAAWRQLPRSQVHAATVEDSYRVWLMQEAARTPPREWYIERAKAFRRQPTVSILLPVRGARPEWLEAATESVLMQSYGRWELCVSVCSPNEQWAEDYVLGNAAADDRIRLVRPGVPLGIAGALNRAGELASGEYVALLDQCDVLSPHALHEVTEVLQQSSPDLVYSDEDRIDGSGRRMQPMFKPDWSPDLLASWMYLGRFLVISKAALDRAGWFRSDYDGAEAYDAVLRLTDGAASVEHIPLILHHRRAQTGPDAEDAEERALADAVVRRGWSATVARGPAPCTRRVQWKISGSPLASIVICSRQPKLLRRCLSAIGRATSYTRREIVVVEHQTGNEAAMDKVLRAERCVRVPYRGAFNFAAMNNLAAEAASGATLVLLNDDIEPLVPEWLELLVAQTQRRGVGVAGAKLLYPSGAVEHAGVAVGILDGAGHPGRGLLAAELCAWLDLTRNVSAVTGACLAVRREVFRDLGGLDVRFPVNYNDVDFCLRAREAGLEIVYEASAVLRHYEAQSRLPYTTLEERERFHERWGRVIGAGDRFYNPNLTRTREDASFRFEDFLPSPSA
jgi:GT2 family glycosyltransferase